MWDMSRVVRLVVDLSVDDDVIDDELAEALLLYLDADEIGRLPFVVSADDVTVAPAVPS
jgi:hypothetical protein